MISNTVISKTTIMFKSMGTGSVVYMFTETNKRKSKFYGPLYYCYAGSIAVMFSIICFLCV